MFIAKVATFVPERAEWKKIIAACIFIITGEQTWSLFYKFTEINLDSKCYAVQQILILKTFISLLPGKVL